MAMSWGAAAAAGQLVALINPQAWFANVANSTGPLSEGFNLTVTGGTGSYTYTWAVSGTGFSIAAGQGTASVVIECVNDSNNQFLGNVQCTVSDGAGSVIPSAPMDVVYGTPE